MKQYKVVIEKHADGYVAYPVGLKGVIVGQGEIYEEALRDVTSAIKFHLETFGEADSESSSQISDVFVVETAVDA